MVCPLTVWTKLSYGNTAKGALALKNSPVLLANNNSSKDPLSKDLKVLRLKSNVAQQYANNWFFLGLA